MIALPISALILCLLFWAESKDCFRIPERRINDPDKMREYKSDFGIDD